MKVEIDRDGDPSAEVRATTMAKSETAPFDVHIFCPSRTK